MEPFCLPVFNGGWQNQVALQTNYQRIASEWRTHLGTFVEKPQLRAYFEIEKNLGGDDPCREAVLAIADVRLDVMDGILTYFAMWGKSDDIAGWENTFSATFRSAPYARAYKKRAETTVSLSLSQTRPANSVGRHNQTETPRSLPFRGGKGSSEQRARKAKLPADQRAAPAFNNARGLLVFIIHLRLANGVHNTGTQICHCASDPARKQMSDRARESSSSINTLDLRSSGNLRHSGSSKLE